MPTPLTFRGQTPWYGVLLGSMLLQLVLSPILLTGDIGVNLERLLAAITLLTALLVLNAHWAILALFVPMLALQIAPSYSAAPFLRSASVTSLLLLLGAVLTVILRRVLRERRVGWDTVAGVSCAYLIMGAMWGDIYFLVEHWWPGSFSIPSGFATPTDGGLRATFTYFSFITLTTVGYGEVHPTSAGIGGLCVAEAVIGQLYLAIMISRMVGLHISAAAASADSSDRPGQN